MKPTLTIGIATFDDWYGLWPTIQSIRINNKKLMPQIEFVVIDSNPSGPHGQMVRQFLQAWIRNCAGVKYIAMESPTGTSPNRDRIFQEATGTYVLVMDGHVELDAGALQSLFDYYEKNPDTKDIISGPLLYDGLDSCSTHFSNIWRSEMWGIWGSAWTCKCGKCKFSMNDVDGRAKGEELTMERKPFIGCSDCSCTLPDVQWAGHETSVAGVGFRQLGMSDDAPFEIPGQGLGLFSCRKDAWLGFHPLARGFGGEELYIHEKFRQAERKAICIPQLRWNHRFGRPDGVPYPISRWNKVRNYVLEFKEIGRDVQEVYRHFVTETGTFPQAQWDMLIVNPEAMEAEPAEAKQGCGSCGGGAPQKANFPNMAFLWEDTVTRERDLDKHMPKLRELASKVKHVTEISNRRESSISFLAAGPDKFISYNTEVDGVVLAAIEFSKLRTVYQNIKESNSNNIPAIEETDMLFLDSEHTYGRLKAELERYAPKVSRFIVMHDTDLFGKQGQDGQEPGMLKAISEYVRANPEWTVIEHTPMQYGLTVLSKSEEDKGKIPWLPTAGWNFISAVAKHVMDGTTKVSKELYEARLEKCTFCPKLANGVCTVCACPVEDKAAWRSEDCPLAFWPLEVVKKEEVKP